MEIETFRSIRLYLNMSQRDFAKFIGIGESTVFQIEAGNRMVSDKIAARVARRFEVTDEFITFLENRKKLYEG